MNGRLGDVVIAPFAPVSLFEEADSGPFNLICRHGSLTEDEVLVPLIAGQGRGKLSVIVHPKEQSRRSVKGQSRYD